MDGTLGPTEGGVGRRLASLGCRDWGVVADGDAGKGRAPLLVRWRLRVEPWHLWLAALVVLGLSIRLGYVVG